MRRSHILLLLAALLAALAVRAPGIFWGYNFPGGWYGHHVDEYAHVQLTKGLINPYLKLEWQHPYPKGMATHVAVPVHVWNLARGKLRVSRAEDIPAPPATARMIVIGRVVSVLYGAASLLVVFLLARNLFSDPRVSLLAAWILAFSGLHVSQSHFFVSDVSSLFWSLLGTYLLLRENEAQEPARSNFLFWAAFCFGFAVGLKLTIPILFSLLCVALLRPPRITRAIHAGVFLFAGFIVVSFASYSPMDIAKTFLKGLNDPFLWSFVDNVKLYLIELPSYLSLPVVLLAVCGTAVLTRKMFRDFPAAKRLPVLIVVVLPLLIHVYLVVFKLDHFARHIIPFVPWTAMAAAAALLRMADFLRARGLHPAFLYAVFFGYLALFVYDGERVFLKEPRNEAGRWLQQNIPPGTKIYWRTHDQFPGYRTAIFPLEGRPPVLLMEMYRENPVLSGMSWRNSFPRDYRYIFEARSQKYVDETQALFKGETEYREVARFQEGYFMPEFVWVDRLIGNRSRNYVTEIVIFTRPLTPDDTTGDSASPVGNGAKSKN